MILNNRLAVSDEKITERELNARKFVRKAAAEGAVLLKMTVHCRSVKA